MSTYDPERTRLLIEAAVQLKAVAKESAQMADEAQQLALDAMKDAPSPDSYPHFEGEDGAVLVPRIRSSKRVKWDDKAMWLRYGTQCPEIFKHTVIAAASSVAYDEGKIEDRDVAAFATITYTKPYLELVPELTEEEDNA